MSEPYVEMVVAQPAPALRGAVGAYCGYRLDGIPAGLHRGLPSRHMTFIISLDGPVETIALPDPGQRSGSWQAFVGGLHTTPALVRQAPRQCGIAVALEPLGCRALFGLPAAALGPTVVELADLLGPSAVGLIDRLAGADEWNQRFAILDEALLAQARAVEGTRPASPGAAPELAWAWRQMVRSGGSIGVAELAGEVGWGRRHFGERFRRELGLPPKAAARVMRFDRACRLLRDPARRPPGLAGLAAACGYYDQAHLAGEWRGMAGCTLTTWISEELPLLETPELASFAS